ELIGIAELTAVLTKIDRVPADRLAAVKAEIGALLAEVGYADSPVYPVSSLNGEGIPALAEHLRNSARIADAARAARPVSGRFRLAIDRAFSLPGIGLVVTGTGASGEVAIGDRLTLSPRGIELRVRG